MRRASRHRRGNSSARLGAGEREDEQGPIAQRAEGRSRNWMVGPSPQCRSSSTMTSGAGAVSSRQEALERAPQALVHEHRSPGAPRAGADSRRRGTAPRRARRGTPPHAPGPPRLARQAALVRPARHATSRLAQPRSARRSRMSSTLRTASASNPKAEPARAGSPRPSHTDRVAMRGAQPMQELLGEARLARPGGRGNHDGLGRPLVDGSG